MPKAIVTNGLTYWVVLSCC